MRTRKNPLARLDQAAKAAEVVLAAREATRSEERQALLAGWKSRPASAGIPEGVTEEERERIAGEEEDFRLLVSVEENVYQYELKHGPLAAVLPAEDDPLLSSEELRVIPDAELFAYGKGILQSGWRPNWEARAEMLASQAARDGLPTGDRQAAGERQ